MTAANSMRIRAAHHRRHASAGFSLIEMAMVLMIMTLVLGGLMMPLSAQIDVRRTSETQQTLENIKEALVGYAMSHRDTTVNTRPYLPCPDIAAPLAGFTHNDGQEDRDATTGACAAPTEGNLPWVTLGVGNADAWGNRFHYRVSADFSNASNGFSTVATPPSAGDIDVCSTPDCSTPLADNTAVVIVSYGKNGWGALNSNGTVYQAPTSADELENTDNDTTYVSRPPASPGANEFDDLLAWLSPDALFGRICPNEGCP